MKRFHMTMICVFALMTLLASPARSLTIGDRPSTVRVTGTIHGAGGANNAPGTFGIAQMECRCSVTIRGNRQSWRFKEEPRITGVDPEGPAAGKLEKGDVIVAIDGLLITTRKAGRRFGSVIPGEAVELTVRRDGETLTESVVAVEVTTDLPALGSVMDSAMTEHLERLSAQVEALARQAAELQHVAELRELRELSELPEIPELTELLEGLEIPELPKLPTMGYGFGLSFSGSIHRDDDTDHMGFEFDSPPRVTSVEPGGRADRAGIKRGDVLTHINGKRIDSREGGREFSKVEPGQKVTWTVRRRSETTTVEMIAGERESDRD